MRALSPDRFVMPYKDATKKAAVLIPSLEDLFWQKRRELALSRTRLFTRVSHPSDLFEGESYNVDLERPWFEGTMNDEAVSFGPAQLVGTYLPSNGSWLWGWHNEGIPKVGYEDLRKSLSQSQDLRDILSCDRFDCSAEFADNLATLAAIEGGFLGAYPAATGEAIAYLAVKLAGTKGRGFAWKDNFWCCLCGCWPEQVEALIAGPDEVYLCNNCIGNFSEMAAEAEADQDDTSDTDLLMPGCLMCGREEVKRIYSQFSALCPECIETSSQILVEKGLELSGNGHLEEAPVLPIDDEKLLELNAQITAQPDSADCYIDRGAFFLDNNLPDEALLDFKKAVELEPEDGTGHYFCGYTNAIIFKHKQAIRDLNKAIELNPEDGPAYAIRGDCWTVIGGKVDQAIADYSKAITLGETNAEIYLARALHFGSKGDRKAALADLNQAVKKAPENAETHTRRAEFYLSAQDLKSALRDFNKAIELDPHDYIRFYNRALIFEKKDEIENALLDLASAILLYPEDAQIYAMRSRLLEKKGDLKGAKQERERALAIDANIFKPL